MPITVELQDMHSYSFIMIAVVIMFVAVSIACAVVIILKRRRKKAPQPITQMPAASRENIKQKYINLLGRLEQNCQAERISNRKAYQELSRIVRHFVYEATGIKVQNYTLQEIEVMNVPGLYAIVSECYVPEFAIDKNGDIYGSINRARRVIGEWN